MKRKLKEIKSAPATIHALAIEIFRNHPNKSFNPKQMMRQMTLSNPAILNEFNPMELRFMIIQLLKEVCEKGKIIETERGKYKLFPEQNLISGRIDITSTGAAYVMNENYEDDIYIAPKYVRNSLNGDLVKVNLFAKREGKRMQGEVIEILERFKTDFAGTVQLSSGFAFLVPDSSKTPVDIFIPPQSINGARNGQKAIARITEWERNAKNPSGEIIKVLGYPGENNAEMDSILVEYGFPLEFPDHVEEEAGRIAVEISRGEIAKRRDFRKITTFTIDPEDAKDFDDALSIRKLENGNYEIGVHIADVTHYVPEKTALDIEGLNRATSIYLVDRVIPMLPEKLSNQVCSLRPNEDKLCFSAVFELDAYAQVKKEWFGRTIIHSDKRFTYEEAQKIIETGKGILSEELSVMNRLAKKLREGRFKKGAVSFEKSEIKFRLDAEKNPIGVIVKEAKDSNKLIEEFMLLANRKVAEFIGKNGASYVAQKVSRKLPFVYRIHDVPVGDRVKEFARFAAQFGYKINTSSDKELAHSLNKLLEEVKGKPEQNVLEQLAIRTMAKAIYSTDNIGHYGLAFDYYTHFTSPIRRYPDMMAHRLLYHYLNGGKPVNEKEYESRCKHSSEMEMKAAEAERSSIKFKMAQFMEKRIGNAFDGIITGVTEWGIYVELTETKCEGMVRLRDMNDDYYELDERSYSIVGIRTKKKYHLGDNVRVLVKDSDPVRKQIDLMFVSPQEVQKKQFMKKKKKM